MLDAQRLRSGLPVGRIGMPLFYSESVGSTNEVAAKVADDGSPEGTLVTALEQTAGKGRGGSKWDTAAGSGLALSVVLRPPRHEVAALGLVGALATVEALDRLRLAAEVKWPNDVLLDGRKAAGVLAEAKWLGSALEYVVLGIGLNVTAEAVANASTYGQPTTYVERALEAQTDQTDLLLAVLAGLDLWYARFLSGSAHPRWEERLAFKNQEVAVRQGGEQITGRVLGLGPNGELRLAAEDGKEIRIRDSGSTVRPA
jgi:BirA family biotin operon repressor/biotin-[acetyl-CoA-carboxylase] ligase